MMKSFALLVFISLVLALAGCATSGSKAFSIPKNIAVTTQTQADQLPSQKPKNGPVGLGDRWSVYGDYMKVLIETVDAEWHGIVDDYQGHIPAGAHVIVTFKLSSDGVPTITKLEVPPDKAMAGILSDQCMRAIKIRQPYPKWTSRMISSLGTEQTITFGFYYY